MKKIICIASLLILFSAAGCTSTLMPTPSPEKAIGTAIVSRKFTDAAAATLSPITSLPTEEYSTPDWSSWTPSPNEITAEDSGEIFDFVLTSRFSIVLRESVYPAANVVSNCVSDNVLGSISNVEPAPPYCYVLRYEGVGIGQCIIRNGLFEVTINITDQN